MWATWTTCHMPQSRETHGWPQRCMFAYDCCCDKESKSVHLLGAGRSQSLSAPGKLQRGGLESFPKKKVEAPPTGLVSSYRILLRRNSVAYYIRISIYIQILVACALELQVEEMLLQTVDAETTPCDLHPSRTPLVFSCPGFQF